MFQSYKYHLSTSRLEGDSVVPIGLTIKATLEGIFDETECNVIRKAEFEGLFAPWFKLFEGAPLNRYIQRPTPINVGIFLVTVTNRIVDTHVIRSMQLEIRGDDVESYTLDTRTLSDMAVATRGGPWRGHTLESLTELATRFPEMFSLEEISEIQESFRTAKKKMNETINRVKVRRLRDLMGVVGGSLTQS